MLREQVCGPVHRLDHLLLAFAYTDSADRITVEVHFGEDFRGFFTQVPEDGTLHDTEHLLSVLERLAARNLLPAECDFQ